VNDRHSDDAMINDALAREIEDALAVEPSPHFAARVIANKPTRTRWRFSWTFAVAAAGAAATIIVAVLVMPGRNPRARVASPESAALPPVSARAPNALSASREETRTALAPAAATPVAPAAPAVARPGPAVPVVARVQPKEPEVLFAKDETAALQRLTRGFTRGVVDPATLSAPSTPTLAAIQPAAIVVAPLAEISPVTIESLGSLVEGVRQ
jgi:hypothetical protein